MLAEYSQKNFSECCQISCVNLIVKVNIRRLVIERSVRGIAQIFLNADKVAYINRLVIIGIALNMAFRRVKDNLCKYSGIKIVAVVYIVGKIINRNL